MENDGLDGRLKRIQQAEMKGRVVLVRVDHNVVKKGLIKDPYRIDASLGTLYTIAEKGGRPVLMTHVGRPRDEKTGKIRCREEESIGPIVRYLREKLAVNIHAQEFPIDPGNGIRHLDGSIKPALEDLKAGKIGMIYLPNSRWFQGEQADGLERDAFARELAGIADLYVNDAFGSYRAHASTYDVTKHLPSFAGLLLQKEIGNLKRVLEPRSPFLAVVAGAKYDTKIGPVKALYSKVDYLILGGLMYNAFLAAKYGVQISGVSDEDRGHAMELVEMDQKEKKILEMPYLVESDTMDERIPGRYRTVDLRDFKTKKEYKNILDIDPKSFEEAHVREAFETSATIFVNAVMGLMPYFSEGSRALYRLIAKNRSAMKLFGGGDTLQELKNLCPGIYMEGVDALDTYYFTGGGSVLAALEKGDPYSLKPVEALMDKG